MSELTLADITPAIIKAFEGRLTIARVQEIVADFYGISTRAMTDRDGCSGIREFRFSHPRQVAMFLCRKFTRMSLPEIGRRFGGRDHTTVLHAVRATEERACSDPYLDMELEVLRERLSAFPPRFVVENHSLPMPEEQAEAAKIAA